MEKTYLSLHSLGKKSSVRKSSKLVKWKGLSQHGVPDCGYLSKCRNCSVSDDFSCVESEKGFYEYTSFAALHGITDQEAYLDYKFLGIYFFASKLFIVYKDLNTREIKIDYVVGAEKNDYYTCTLGTVNPSDERPRTMILFNEWDGDTNIAQSSYSPIILVYPDMYYFDLDFKLNQSEHSFNATYFGTDIPKSHDACVYLSRVFSVSDDKVFATGTTYDDYTLDTADDFSEGHAWVSLASGSSGSDGKLTAITTYNGRVLVFKNDYMYEIYNNKNPFRLIEICKVGTVDKRSVCEVDGKLYFASADGIYCYSGGIPQKISHCLGDISFSESVGGSYRNRYYLYNSDGLTYIYNPKNNMFGTISTTGEGEAEAIVGFTGSACDEVFFCLMESGVIHEINNVIPSSREFYFETDIRSFGELDNKRIKEIRFLAYSDNPYHDNAFSVLAGVQEHTGRFKEIEVFSTDSMDRKEYLPVKIMLRGFNGNLHKLRFQGVGLVKIYHLEIITD